MWWERSVIKISLKNFNILHFFLGRATREGKGREREGGRRATGNEHCSAMTIKCCHYIGLCFVSLSALCRITLSGHFLISLDTWSISNLIEYSFHARLMRECSCHVTPGEDANELVARQCPPSVRFSVIFISLNFLSHHLFRSNSHTRQS